MHPGKMVKRWRVERDLSLEQLSVRSGVDKMALSKIERGASDPHISTLQKISTALDVPMSALVSEAVTQSDIAPASTNSDAVLARLKDAKKDLRRLHIVAKGMLETLESTLADFDDLADDAEPRKRA